MARRKRSMARRSDFFPEVTPFSYVMPTSVHEAAAEVSESP